MASGRGEDRWRVSASLSNLEKRSAFWVGLFLNLLLYQPWSTCTKRLRRLQLPKRNAAIKKVEGGSRLGLGPGVSLTWNRFSQKKKKKPRRTQAWERVGGLGGFQLLLSVGSPSTEQYLERNKPPIRRPKAVKGGNRWIFSWQGGGSMSGKEEMVPKPDQ